MAYCYNCEAEITASNSSIEHVIPNACGGRLKSSKLLCKRCNSFFGEKFDKRLADQTNHLANLLIIKRDRDDPRSIRAREVATGDIVDLQYGQKPRKAIPKIKEDFQGDVLHAQFTGYSEMQLADYLKSLKRKYPGFNIEEARKRVKRSSEYLSEGVEFPISIGGQDTFRSITKSAINFYMLNGGGRQFIQHLLPYIQGAPSGPPCMIHYPEKRLYIPGPDEVSHVIEIFGDTDQRILYAYVEIFNCHNFVVLLNESYQGGPFNETYIFDVIAQKRLSKSLEVRFSKAEINDHLIMRSDSRVWEVAKEQIGRVLAIADKIQINLGTSIVMDKVLKKFGDKYPDGTMLTPEQMDEFFEDFVAEFSLFLAHRFTAINK